MLWGTCDLEAKAGIMPAFIMRGRKSWAVIGCILVLGRKYWLCGVYLLLYAGCVEGA